MGAAIKSSIAPLGPVAPWRLPPAYFVRFLGGLAGLQTVQRDDNERGTLREREPRRIEDDIVMAGLGRILKEMLLIETRPLGGRPVDVAGCRVLRYTQVLANHFDTILPIGNQANAQGRGGRENERGASAHNDAVAFLGQREQDLPQAMHVAAFTERRARGQRSQGIQNPAPPAL